MKNVYRIYVKGGSMRTFGAINGNGGVAGTLINALTWWNLEDATTDYKKMVELNPDLNWQLRDTNNKTILKHSA